MSQSTSTHSVPDSGGVADRTPEMPNQPLLCVFGDQTRSWQAIYREEGGSEGGSVVSCDTKDD